MTEKTMDTVVRDVRVHVFSRQYDCRESLSERMERLNQRAGGFATMMGEPSAEAYDDGAEEDIEEMLEALYEAAVNSDPGEPYTMITDGRLRMRGDLCELSYEECGGEEGIEDTKTTLVFSKRHPNIVTLTRSGMLKMTLSFEAGRYHVGTYRIGALQALFSDSREGLTLSSYARAVDNRLLTEGKLFLDYVIEVRGMDTQRVVFELSLSDVASAPTPVTRDRYEDLPTEGGVMQ